MINIAREYRENNPYLIQVHPVALGLQEAFLYDGPSRPTLYLNRQINLMESKRKSVSPYGLICGIEFYKILFETPSSVGVSYFKDRLKVTINDRFPTLDAVIFSDSGDMVHMRIQHIN